MKKFPLLFIVTTLLIIITIICVLNPGFFSYMGMLAALAAASILMLLHLFIAWRRLAITTRLSIVLCITAWMGLFYGLLHSSGFFNL